MTTPDAETTDESTWDSTTEWRDVARRPLLKALGIGAALSLGGHTAAAASNEDDTEHGVEATGGQIDPVWGYPTRDAEDLPDGIEPDHEVELHRDPFDPENPDHPSIFHFEPSGLHVNGGDVVQFTFTAPNHTVTDYHPDHGFQRRVPEDVPAFSSPIVPEDGAWLYRFEHEGLYDLYCGPHEIAGMAMRVVVGELDEEAVPDYEDTFEAEPPLFPPLSPEFLEQELNATSDRNENVEWTPLTDRQVLDADALDPTNIQDAGEVSFETVADELGVEYDPEHG